MLEMETNIKGCDGLNVQARKGKKHLTHLEV